MHAKHSVKSVHIFSFYGHSENSKENGLFLFSITYSDFAFIPKMQVKTLESCCQKTVEVRPTNYY